MIYGRILLVLYVSLLAVYNFSLKIFLGAEKYIFSPNHASGLINGSKYNFCYLTIWTFVFQMVFLTVAVLDESLKLVNLPTKSQKHMNLLLKFQKQLQKFRSLFFHTLVFPPTVIVGISFWALWHMDKELVMPKVMVETFPLWLNHVLHTSIGIAALVEVLLVQKKQNVKFRTIFPYILAFSASYNSVYYSIYFLNGHWLYPVFYHLNWFQRLFTSIYQTGALLGVAKLGLTLHDLKKSPKIIRN